MSENKHNINVMVTGANGFVGEHLVTELAEHGHNVIAIGGPHNKLHEHGHAQEYHNLDLTNPEALEQFKGRDIDAVVNLAGLAAVGQSFDNPQRYISTNTGIVTTLGEHFQREDRKPRIVHVSTGAVYGPAPGEQPELPTTEHTLLSPTSPYAVSKIQTEAQAAYYRRRGLDMVIARPFNHTGPGQERGYLVPDLIHQLRSAQESNQTLMVGNLATKRDYTDVRDIAAAYRKLVEAHTLSCHIYNVASGVSHSGEEILARLQQLTHTTDVAVEVDPTKIRPNDPMDIYGDSSKLREDTGWAPRYDLEQTLSDSVKASQK